MYSATSSKRNNNSAGATMVKVGATPHRIGFRAFWASYAKSTGTKKLQTHRFSSGTCNDCPSCVSVDYACTGFVTTVATACTPRGPTCDVCSPWFRGRPTEVGRCCRGVPSPGPVLCRGGCVPGYPTGCPSHFRSFWNSLCCRRRFFCSAFSSAAARRAPP